jgi:hypothetical protein
VFTLFGELALFKKMFVEKLFFTTKKMVISNGNDKIKSVIYDIKMSSLCRIRTKPKKNGGSDCAQLLRLLSSEFGTRLKIPLSYCK